MNWKKLLLKSGLIIAVLAGTALVLFVCNIESFSRPAIEFGIHVTVCALAVAFIAVVCLFLWFIWNVL